MKTIIVLVLLLCLSAPVRACEILVLAEDRGTNPQVFSRGDVISVQADGWVWGSAERLPTFWKLVVTGATKADCEAYAAPIFDADGNYIRVRGKRLDYNSLSTPQKRALDRDGLLTVTKAQADSFVANYP